MTPSPQAADPHGSAAARAPHPVSDARDSAPGAGGPPPTPGARDTPHHSTPEAGGSPPPPAPRDSAPHPTWDAGGAPAGHDPSGDRLRRLLGPAALRLDATPRDRVLGWVGPLLVTAVAAVLRLVHLDRPPTLVFDETYYVKQAYTLLRVGYEAQWPDEPNPAFEAGDVDTFLPVADYAVHPQVGKWLIALGMHVAGVEPVGWRLGAALAGTLTVLLLARIARRLFASTLLGTLAGGLLAIDGQAIVHSRTGLLDGFLTLFAVAAFGALLLDRDRARFRLARSTVRSASRSGLGPGLGVRPWRLAAGVLLGLAIGTKWSGLYFLAVFGLLTVTWDVAARRAAGVRRWLAGGVLRDGVPAFVALVPVAAVTYVASWASWFRTPGGYGRDWAGSHPGEGILWLPESLRSWWRYHEQMWTFHRGLTSEHGYAAHPLGWPLQWRPTSFYYEAPVPARAACGADRCSAAITAIGNPVLWWAASLAVVAAVWWLVRHRDGRAGAALSGVVAGWLPWLGYAERTVFTFYSVAFAPWMVLTLTWALGRLVGVPDGVGAAPGGDVAAERRRWGVAAAVALIAVAVAVSAFFYPMWTAQPVPFRYWQMHIWLPTWV